MGNTIVGCGLYLGCQILAGNRCPGGNTAAVLYRNSGHCNTSVAAHGRAGVKVCRQPGSSAWVGPAHEKHHRSRFHYGLSTPLFIRFTRVMKKYSLAFFAVLALCLSARAVTEPTIDLITFTGNPPAGEGALLRGSGLRRGVSIFLVSQRQVADAVVANLMSRGYLDCSVSVIWPRWGSETYEVVIHVDPGVLSLRGRLLFSGDSTFSTDELARLCPIEFGEPIAPSDTASFALSIRNRYASRGYLNTEVGFILSQPSDTLAEVHRDLNVNIQSNHRYYLGGITVSGLEKVREAVVVREFDISPGNH
jgi:hypothetical protein